jgi:hypothetical protein
MRRDAAILVGVQVRFVLVVLLLAACGKSAEQCRLEAEAFGKLLAEADTEMSSPIWSTRVNLPLRRDFTHRELRRAPVVTVVPGGFAYGPDDEPITRDNLRDALLVERARMRSMMEGSPRLAARSDPRMVYFAIDQATPWSEVVDAISLAARTELTAPVFLFAYPVTSTSPPRAPIDDELDRIMTANASDRATKLAALITTLVEDCPALQKSFSQVGSEDGESKAAVIVRAIPEGLAECNCKVPMDDFRSAMWRLLVSATPMRALVIDPTAPAQQLALPGTTTWGEASKRLTPATKNVTFVVR